MTTFEIFPKYNKRVAGFFAIVQKLPFSSGKFYEFSKEFITINKNQKTIIKNIHSFIQFFIIIEYFVKIFFLFIFFEIHVPGKHNKNIY